MKSVIFVLLVTLISSCFAEKVMNITNPNMQTVWQFGQIYEVDWVTEATGSETLALYYFENGKPEECQNKPFMSINVPHVELGKVFFDLTATQELQEVMKELPVQSNNYFLHFGTSKDSSYSTRFTISGGKLTEQDVANAKNSKSAASTYAFTAVIAIIVGIMTTIVNVL
ncbi:hypothetical protein LY90DRAFT_664236 [Neocallimastix californiae]|jgi:hypothetical protein|uniref:Uncharacterized protein n=1 Tax=Neocallimastix californiae TaxID=1754190 RepID=A0A1Y2FCR9_9FUNG|nr:hypothetical protein LY90DRAFT_664236 [Neocallimastix californiae]|eukprot:ORY81701.1 hypothetical protein LY90DRAFT_664236 [Neocallimastix californiae]